MQQKGHAFLAGVSLAPEDNTRKTKTNSRLADYILLSSKIRVAAFMSAAFLFVFMGLFVFPIASNIDDIQATSKQSETVLTISADDITLNFEIDSATGSFAEDSADISIATNNITGYTLSINTGNTGDNAGKLVGENQSFNPISGATSEADFTNSTDYNGLWGYKPSKVNGEANTNYLPAPTETTTIEETNAPNQEANTYEIGLGARADLSYEAGGYTNTFVITGVANPVGYTITYDKNTEDTVTNMPEAQNGITAEQTITLRSNTPEREGYDFLGWCDGDAFNSNCLGSIIQPGGVYEIDHLSQNSMNMRALWDDGTRSIIFDGNGADEGSMEPQIFVSGDTIELNENQFFKDDYLFIGWNTRADGTGTRYQDKSAYTGDNVVLYAQWDQVTAIAVNYHNDDSVNTVIYGCYVGDKHTVKYSHTSNISDSGINDGGYDDNLSMNEVIKISGASSLHIKITYQTEGVAYDWLSLWAGSHPDYTAEDNYASGIRIGNNTTGKYGGTNKKTVEVDVPGDSVTFGFVADGAVNDYYGYYAIVTAENGTTCLDEPISGQYEALVPVEDYLDGWVYSLSDEGIDYTNEDDVKNGLDLSVQSTDLYATYIRKKAMLATGRTVRLKFERISRDYEYSYSDNKLIKKIIMADSLPADFVRTNDNTISARESYYPINAWFDNTDEAGIMYIYSEKEVYLNPDSSELFYGLSSLEDISGVTNWKAGEMKNAERMFAFTQKLTNIDSLSNWDTLSVTNMRQMFYEANYNQGLTNIDALSKWNISNVTNMEGMFSGTRLTDIDGAISWNTSNVTNMKNMFYYNQSLANIDGAINWNTSHVTDMSWMFYESRILTNINGAINWNTSSVTDMRNMFGKASVLNNINGATNWDTSLVTRMDGMFEGTAIENIDVLATVRHEGKDYVSWNTSNVTSMKSMFKDARLANINGAINWNTSSVTDMEGMFYGASYLANINGAAGWNTSSVTNMRIMFNYTQSLTNINGAAGWNTSSVTDMSGMFGRATSLTNIDGATDWNTSSVTDMSGMFSGDYSLSDIDGATDWNTSSVTDMSGMFRGATSLVNIGAVSGWDTSSVTDMSNMFEETAIDSTDALATVQHEGKNYVSWNTSSVTNMGWMFDGTNIADVDGLINWDTSNVTNMSGMFATSRTAGAPGSLIDISGLRKWDTSNVITMNNMFSSYSGTSLDALSEWKVSKVKNMSGMFAQNSRLTSLSGLEKWDTSSVIDMGSMFSVFYILYGGVPQTKMESALSNIDSISGWNVSNVTNMSRMFAGNILISVDALSGWNTSKVTSIDYMFYDDVDITWLQSINGWETQSMTSMKDVFYNIPCSVIRPIWYSDDSGCGIYSGGGDDESGSSGGGGESGVTIERAYEMWYTSVHKGMYEEIEPGSNTWQLIDSWNGQEYQGGGRSVRFAFQDFSASICNAITIYDQIYQSLDLNNLTSGTNTFIPITKSSSDGLCHRLDTGAVIP